jgi:hypothetical protein
MKYRYKGTVYEGERDEIIKDLRLSEKLRLPAIGQLFGITRQAVSQALQKYELSKQLAYPELEDKNLFFTKTPEKISQEYNIQLYLVERARKEHGIKRSRVDLAKRRRELALYLFGKNPGNNFQEVISEVIEQKLARKQRNNLIRFICGRTDSHYDRTYRVRAKRRLKKIIGKMDRDWVKEGVIVDE